MLLPPSIDEFVDEAHPVRVIDAFINSLKVSEYGFTKSDTAITGRKPYHPGDLLKLYIYGYLNQVTSSRALERECHRNLEVIWLLKQLAPDFKTIADFRKENGHAIKQVSRSFILFCRQAGLVSAKTIAIDGSKFKSAASRDSVITKSKLSKQIEQLDSKIDSYLEQLANTDALEPSLGTLNTEKVEQILTSLESQRSNAQSELDQLVESGNNQQCKTEPDAKLMRAGRGGTVAGYNMQNAVDSQHQIVVHHELTQELNDTRSLKPVINAVKRLLGDKPMTILADAGYSNGEQIAKYQNSEIKVALPSNRASKGHPNYFPSSAFSFIEDENVFICPAGKRMTKRTASKKDKLTIYAPDDDCYDCRLKPKCTKSNKRRVSRHFFEDALQEANTRATKPLMQQRMAVVEPPFGTLKRLMNGGRFRCWGKEAAESEYSIGVLSYNLLRATNVMGVKNMLRQLA